MYRVGGYHHEGHKWYENSGLKRGNVKRLEQEVNVFDVSIVTNNAKPSCRDVTRSFFPYHRGIFEDIFRLCPFSYNPDMVGENREHRKQWRQC